MSAQVFRKGSKVWLDVDPYYPEKFKQPNTVFRSWAIAFQAIGSLVDYNTLMGVSGAAFRFQLHKVWCPSSPHPSYGFNCSQTARDVLELDSYTRVYSTNKDPVDEMIKVTMDSIDRGIPVIAHGMETGLFTGYDTSDGEIKLWLRDPYSNRGDRAIPINVNYLRKIPGEIDIVYNIPVLPDEHAFKESIKRAILLAEMQKIEKYDQGHYALERWIHDLGDESVVNDLAEKDGFPELATSNAHILYSLLDARQAAAAYLRNSASTNDMDFKSLESAAGTFDEMTIILRDAMKNVVWEWQLLQHQSEWTQEKRNNQANALKEIIRLEKKVVHELANVYDRTN